MDAQCASCGVAFEAQRSSAKYCGPTCRKRGSRRPEASPDSEPSSALVEATLSELASAGRVDTVLGQQALALASRIANPRDTGSAIAALSRELSRVMSDAVRGAAAADPLDELRARRDRFRSAG